MNDMRRHSEEVVSFMVAFRKLRDMVDDDSTDLTRRALADARLVSVCNEVGSAGTTLLMAERVQRQLFSAPVDPQFIEAWRDYQSRFEAQIADIFWSQLSFAEDGAFVEMPLRANIRWELADDDAEQDANAIETALTFAAEQVRMNSEFEVAFREDIEDAELAWGKLKDEVGFDLRGAFRRRELVPFVLIPSHVSDRHGSHEKLSLLTHLQEAHDAFVLGVHFAALALMRSVLEAVLKLHYQAPGRDLSERIDNCQNLPRGASKMALHRIRTLANEILHFERERAELPPDLELQLLRLLNALRSLIEGAPSPRR